MYESHLLEGGRGGQLYGRETQKLEATLHVQRQIEKYRHVILIRIEMAVAILRVPRQG